MDTGWVIISVVVSFGAGLSIGLYLRRQARVLAEVATRQAVDHELVSFREQLKTRDEQGGEMRRQLSSFQERIVADQERLLGFAGDLARAKAGAEQAVELKASLELESQQVEKLQHELRETKVRAAELASRIPELETQVTERKDELRVTQTDLDSHRKRASELAEQLAKARADLAGAEKRFDDASADLHRIRQRADDLQGDVSKLIEEKARLGADLDGERKAAAERVTEAERSKDQVRAEIEILASRLLDEKGKVMLDLSRAGLEALLKPLGEKLKEFEAKVDKTYDQENRDRATLLESLKQMQETQVKLHDDAESLTRALTGESKAQGDWGELVLERILETAGLTEGREYDLQVSHVDGEGGRKRPDALVYLPANRAVVVDAKCSLTAFVESMRAVTEDARGVALDDHLESVRGHVKSLANKSYQDVLKQRTLDIVLMFIPNEAAFHAAMSRDAGLYAEAFRQRIVICSPTTLLAALQLISHVWRSEKQNINAQKIADEAGKLLEKLSSFVKDLDDVGMRLTQAQDSFALARGKLISGRGNLVGRASAIAKLGARVKSEKVQDLLREAGQEDAEDYGPLEQPLLQGPAGSGAGRALAEVSELEPA